MQKGDGEADEGRHRQAGGGEYAHRALQRRPIGRGGVIKGGTEQSQGRRQRGGDLPPVRSVAATDRSVLLPGEKQDPIIDALPSSRCGNRRIGPGHSWLRNPSMTGWDRLQAQDDLVASKTDRRGSAQ